MKLIQTLPLTLALSLVAGVAAAQDVETLVRVDKSNRSATPAVTRSIAQYIALRNNAPTVQAMVRAQPDTAPAVSVEALLQAIESNSGVIEPTPAAVVTPPPEPEQPKQKPVKPAVNSGGGGGGGSGGGGAGGGGGGGW